VSPMDLLQYRRSTKFGYFCCVMLYSAGGSKHAVMYCMIESAMQSLNNFAYLCAL
jgi:hypothetical protein